MNGYERIQAKIDDLEQTECAECGHAWIVHFLDELDDTHCNDCFCAEFRSKRNQYPRISINSPGFRY